MSPIPVYLAIEDDLSEFVLRKVLVETGRNYAVGTVFGGMGFGYLRSRVKNFNAAASSGTPIILLTDLDRYRCASTLIQDWLAAKPHANLIFRVAIREIESWLLADRVGFAKFLDISEDLVPREPDELDDPKQVLLNLARRSRLRGLKEALLPRNQSTARQGPDYNGCLGGFVRDQWNHNSAVGCSPSLARTWQRLMEFEPTW